MTKKKEDKESRKTDPANTADTTDNTKTGDAKTAAAETAGKSETKETKPASAKTKAPDKPERITARYTGNSPLKVKQNETVVIMLWPNQVYKNLEVTEDVAFLLKKKKLVKIK